MIPRLNRWAALVALTPAVLALAACAGGNSLTMPNAQGYSQVASANARNADRPLAIQNAHPDVTCPKRYLQCFTVSKKKGALLDWCYGPPSDPCSKSNARKVTWSGVVCLAKGKTCKKPITPLTAAWTGPFKCQTKDKCKGTFELDTITPGPGLKQTQSYAYKQDIHICLGSDCEDVYVGMNVGP
jgi:hypothetical protein